MRYFKLLATAVAVFAATAASAAPVTKWTYSVSSAFDISATQYVPSGTTPGAPASSDSMYDSQTNLLQWGRKFVPGTTTAGSIENGNRSGLGINNSPNGGTTDTNGALVAANSYTHYNNMSIGANSWTLSRTVINASLTLSGLEPEVGPGKILTQNYQVRFVETPNNATNCPTKDTDTTLCSDIFTIVGGLGENFTYEGYEYGLQFVATGFTELLPKQCELAGFAVGTSCFGFSTPEGEDYTSQFSFRITRAGEVPEPASIALIGAGLLGLAGLRRRQQKSKA
ncbi:THxN family PEP-CTERM protein [Pseudorhodoferax soli]|uniref:Putative secreted protein n=1 Tax=Pseudorhodoferax soli TaxID=545864 RepID=A0A368Y8X4_9BURK|nr:THxN family PEP-CTERM protein [Pseudorhodoferax soli]RCW74634.1 putative secreted protein [Pseudorhodoferax soli]